MKVSVEIDLPDEIVEKCDVEYRPPIQVYLRLR